jgi:capsular polysaccharide biosynthesis protein
MFVKPFDVDNAPSVKISDLDGRFSIKRWIMGQPPVSRVILDNQRVYNRATPAALFGLDVMSFDAALARHPQNAPWLGFVFARNAITAGAGETIVNDLVLVGTGLMNDPSIFPHPYHVLLDFKNSIGGFEVELPKEKVKLSGTVCNLASAGLEIYGHWLVDCLPRAKLAQLHFPSIDWFLFPAPVTAWKLQLLDFMGIPPEKRVFYDLKRVAVECEKMLLPSFLRFNSEVRPELVKLYADTLGNTNATKVERQIFLSRSKWPGARPLVNRSDIEAIFAASGFEIIFPEAYQLKELVSIFSEASIVVGECGSGMHNTIFCPPKTRIGVMQNPENTNFLQMQMAMWQGQQIFYLIGKNLENSGDGPFTIDATEAKRFIARILT